jgi:hypothetical protein
MVTRVFEWCARFLGSLQNLEDDERSGRPTAVRTPDMIQRVRELISTADNSSDDGRGTRN